jgi:uncharacterized membrane protein
VPERERAGRRSLPSNSEESVSAVVAVHVAAGSISLISGALALAARKGAPLHRAAGTAFFVSMLIMSATAAWLSATLPLRGGVLE